MSSEPYFFHFCFQSEATYLVFNQLIKLLFDDHPSNQLEQCWFNMFYRWNNAGLKCLISDQLPRKWVNIEPAMAESVVFAGLASGGHVNQCL